MAVVLRMVLLVVVRRPASVAVVLVLLVVVRRQAAVAVVQVSLVVVRRTAAVTVVLVLLVVVLLVRAAVVPVARPKVAVTLTMAMVLAGPVLAGPVLAGLNHQKPATKVLARRAGAQPCGGAAVWAAFEKTAPSRPQHSDRSGNSRNVCRSSLPHGGSRRGRSHPAAPAQ